MTIKNAMVLAAGLGTRMRPITDHMPKPLVEVAGKALLDYTLDSLADAGVERAVVNIHHFPDRMIAHLSAYHRLEIIISDERDGLLNNGGGMVKGFGLLPPGPVIVMNADQFWLPAPGSEDDNLRRLMKFYDPARMDMAMLCVEPGMTTGHSEKNDFNLDDEGRLARFRPGDPHPVIYAGAIAMDTTALADAPREPFNINLYFDRYIATGRLFGMRLEGHWVTVGTPEAIAPAEAVMRARVAP